MTSSETLRLIRGPIAAPDTSRRVIALRVDRHTLAKRLWRGTAADGAEFGFQLESALRHGDTFFETSDRRYIVEQEPEPLIEITLEIAPSAAAGIGWAIGNLHLELAGEPTRLLAPDEPAVRQLLERLRVPYRTTHGLFRPGRFNRGEQASHELGTSHRH